MSTAIRLSMLLLALPFAAIAQTTTTTPTAASTQATQVMHLQGRFQALQAPEADTRQPVGDARVMVEADGDARVDMVVSGMTERATSATLHAGDANANNEPVARMDVAVDGSEARIVGATARLTPIVAQQVRNGEAYILLHSNGTPTACCAHSWRRRRGRSEPRTGLDSLNRG